MAHLVQDPLAPLRASEIRTAASLIEQHFPRGTLFHFKAITLHEPDKRDVMPYLLAKQKGEAVKSLTREAFVCYYIRHTNLFYEAIVDLTNGEVTRNVKQDLGVHGPLDVAEMDEVAALVIEDETVKAAIAKLQLRDRAVVAAEPWMYGSDGLDDQNRQYQCFMFMRDPANPAEADSNHYSFPLPISPVVDAATKKVIRVDVLPTGNDETAGAVKPWIPQPPNEYIPEAQKLREDVKPLHVEQPEGVGYTVETTDETGYKIQWQKWSFQVGFNQREGMVLYNICYDGRIIFYRLALSEMNVPYADPRAPFHKKAAFDLGDAGAGATANNLKLGCDCLGSITYLNGVISDAEGQAVLMENVICLHEQDNGIGWKHTNYRTGRAVVTRNRELVLQSILTLANYEYILAFSFSQAGDVSYEVRATGILSTQPIDLDTKSPYGIVVHPGVLAAYHQHIFSLRIDPAIDGASNRVAYDEAVALPRDDTINPHGVGYTVTKTVIETAGGFDLDNSTNRTFKILNDAVKNAVNGESVGYKIHVPAFQPMLAHESSFHSKRAEFADHAIYVTKYSPEEQFAGGKYTNQSRGGTGVRTWADRKEGVRDTDIVVWVQFGINHIPRIEDFPVMPCESIMVKLRPVNFFITNPAIDVPPSVQRVNKSTLVPVRAPGDGSKECCLDASSKL